MFQLMKRGYQVVLLIFLVLLIDQALKIYIKTNFSTCESDVVRMFGADWAQLRFVENEGMAFGITFDWAYGKLALSSFRIILVGMLIWYIRWLLKMGANMGFILCMGMITAGALGNIIDSAFYGMIFTESPVHDPGDCQPATFVPWGQGYGTFLHGKVVDMFYFPMFWVNIPEWIPGIGGERYRFFNSIFNVADAAITVGVILILLFQRRFFKETHAEEAPGVPTAVEIADQIDAHEAAQNAGADTADTEAGDLSDAHPDTHTPDSDNAPRPDEK
ncbi:MAG: lipoprotein signal peptidase [Chitinophagales bacterium]|nr:lipoprotein signal peptidase [Chitinophagales bacterium]